MPSVAAAAPAMKPTEIKSSENATPGYHGAAIAAGQTRARFSGPQRASCSPSSAKTLAEGSPLQWHSQLVVRKVDKPNEMNCAAYRTAAAMKGRTAHWTLAQTFAEMATDSHFEE